MKNYKISSKLVMLNVEHDLSLFNDTLKLTVQHQVVIYRNNNGCIEVDVDVMDYINITYLDVTVENWHLLTTHFKEFGIDVDGWIDVEIEGLELDEPPFMIEMRKLYPFKD